MTIEHIDFSKLPKRYALTVEVKLMELPNQFPEPEEPITFSSDDPMKQAAELMSKGLRVMAPAVPMFPSYALAGFDFRKGITVTVQSFSGLAKIIEQYDELTRQIEAERP